MKVESPRPCSRLAAPYGSSALTRTATRGSSPQVVTALRRLLPVQNQPKWCWYTTQVQVVLVAGLSRSTDVGVANLMDRRQQVGCLTEYIQPVLCQPQRYHLSGPMLVCTSSRQSLNCTLSSQVAGDKVSRRGKRRIRFHEGPAGGWTRHTSLARCGVADG